MRRERLEGAPLERFLQSLTGALVRELAPELVLLFGSFARGDQNRASDVDIVVVTDTDLPFCDRIGWALRAIEGLVPTMPIEALVYTPAEWRRMEAGGNSFVGLLQAEGRVLYERGSKRDGSHTMAEAGPA